jgi:hypothetical protein
MPFFFAMRVKKSGVTGRPSTPRGVETASDHPLAPGNR